MTDYKALYEQQLKKNEELKEQNKRLNTFCMRGRVAEKNSPLEEMYLREAGLMYNDDDELIQEPPKNYPKLEKKMKEYKITQDEEESDVEEDKYDGDDWRWVYGKNIIEQEEYKEVVLIMAGGGDHWENWTMTPNMNYIVNKDGKHPQHGQVLVQSSCGKYVSFQDEDYVCEGDECICEYEHCVESQ